MLDRRAFLCGSVATALALPLAVGAQPPAKAARIGVLCGATIREAFAQGLRELGYADHRHFVIERPVELGDLPRAADDLVRQSVDVIVACTTPEAHAAKEATTSIPIVALSEDPVGSGLAASLARPGGNVTGLSLLSSELGAKRLQLLKEAVPRASRIAVFWAFYRPQLAPRAELKAMQDAASALDVKLVILGARLPNEHDDVLAAAIRAQAEAVIVTTDTVGSPHDARLKELLVHYRLPAVFHRREDAEAGGLMSFGVSIPAVASRAAIYVDRILKGARPSDLPIEHPAKFELVINLKTARVLGLTIPPSLLLRADQVIE
jgi:putative ABC transport system substrate-binding protein